MIIILIHSSLVFLLSHQLQHDLRLFLCDIKQMLIIIFDQVYSKALETTEPFPRAITQRNLFYILSI